MTQEQSELTDRTFRSLGHFVASFSWLVARLEDATVELIDPPQPECSRRVMAALANREAYAIVCSFFSVLSVRWENGLTDDDRKVLSCLRKEIIAVIEERNRLMHDQWDIGGDGGDPGPHPLVRMRNRAHSKGFEFEIVQYEPEQLDNWSEKIERLIPVVNGIARGRSEESKPCIALRYEVVKGEVQERASWPSKRARKEGGEEP